MQQQQQKQQQPAARATPARLSFHPLHRAGADGADAGDAAARPSAGPRPSALPVAAIIPGDTIAEQVFTSGLESFLSLYNSALVVRLVLTWFPSVPEAITSPLATLCDPYLNLFRGIIPPIGGTLDLSPILAFVTLSVFSNTAAALPCEAPAAGLAAAEGRAEARAARRQVQRLSAGAAAATGGGAAWGAPRCGSIYQRAWERRAAAAAGGQARAMRHRVERAAACEDGRAAC